MNCSLVITVKCKTREQRYKLAIRDNERNRDLEREERMENAVDGGCC